MALPSEIPNEDWQRFVMSCQKHASIVERDTITLCWSRWSLGKVIRDWKGNQKSRADYYGKGMMEDLSDQIGMHVKTLYHCSSTAKHMPTKKHVQIALESIKLLNKNNKVTWEAFRVYSLPSNNPDEHGGEHKRNLALIKRTEIILGDFQDYINKDMMDEEIDQVIGVLTHVATVVVEMMNVMKNAGQEIDIPLIPKTEIIPGTWWTPTRREGFKQWIKGQPCVICGDPQVDPAHFPESTGAGADTTDIIPLCRDHHNEQHDSGIETFWENWFHFIIKWYQEWPRLFYKSYVEFSNAE